ncbi:hypothetical protein HK097_009081 [Rhizophlyctis rosea]|uniref:Transmembrane protein n=1 Tax=Rhizophlyctis rosea TaxID=64517 RepID=A0AAD5X3I4_9FUNG|nr:hypothetical protein HK097_009081 [Rhizophlyctis rosea]
MGANLAACYKEDDPTEGDGWRHIACSFNTYGYSLSIMMVIVSSYLCFYFNGRKVWAWLFGNCFFMFLGHETYIVLNSLVNRDSPPTLSLTLKQYLFPISLIFWSLSEMGDIILFYERFKIVHAAPIEKWFLSLFFGSLSCALVTRSVDIYYAGQKHELHDQSVWMIEPTYLVFLLVCEGLLQWRYTVSVMRFAKGANVARKALLLTLLRSAGARFLMILVPMLARSILSYIHKDQNDPRRVMTVAFNTSVNLFTMVDLLMLKYELLNQSRNKTASRMSSTLTGTWDHPELPPQPLSIPQFTFNNNSHTSTTHYSDSSKHIQTGRLTPDQSSYVMRPVSSIRKLSMNSRGLDENFVPYAPNSPQSPRTPGAESAASRSPLVESPIYDRERGGPERHI